MKTSKGLWATVSMGALLWSGFAVAATPRQVDEQVRRDGNTFLLTVDEVRGSEATAEFRSAVDWAIDRLLCRTDGFARTADYDFYRSMTPGRKKGVDFTYWMKCKANFLGFDSTHKEAFLGGIASRHEGPGFFVKPDRIFAQVVGRPFTDLPPVLTSTELAYLAGYATAATMESASPRLPRFLEEWLGEHHVRIPELPLFPEPAGDGANVARVAQTAVARESVAHATVENASGQRR